MPPADRERYLGLASDCCQDLLTWIMDAIAAGDTNGLLVLDVATGGQFPSVAAAISAARLNQRPPPDDAA